jgi:alpha-tubulin suppressor-like RCC1 family protein
MKKAYIYKYFVKKFTVNNNVSITPGHPDTSDKLVPTLVKEVRKVGQVALGNTHTLVVSQDGHTVWSFGGGETGECYFLYIVEKNI